MLHVSVVEHGDALHAAIPVRELQITGDRDALARVAELLHEAITTGKCVASLYSYEPGLSVCIRMENG